MKWQKLIWQLVIAFNIAVGIFLALGTMSADAQTFQLSTGEGATAGDFWRIFEQGDALTSRYLNQIFGPLFQAREGTNAQSVLANVLGYFNVFVVSVAGILFFYNITVGVLQSAHEGEVLGRRWSSLWAPLRVIFAVGLLVPLPGLGGYNVVQAGAAYLVRGGTGAASLMWSVAATSILGDDIPLSAEAPRFPPEIVEQVYRQAACLQIVQYQTTLVNEQSVAGWYDVTEISRVRNPTDRISFLTAIRSTPAAEPSLVGLCGGWSTPPPPAYLIDLGSDGEDVIRNFTAGHALIMREVTEGVSSLVAQHFDHIFEGGQTMPDISVDLAEIQILANQEMSEFSREIRSLGIAASGQDDARDMLLTHVSGGENGRWGQGWLGAGSWYIAMARFNNRLSSLTDARSTVLEASLSADPAAIFEAAGGVGSGRTYLFGNLGGRPTEEDLANLPNAHEALRILSGFDRMFEESTVRLAGLGYQLSPAQMSEINRDSSGSLWEYIPGLQDAIERVSNAILSAFNPSNMLSHDPIVSLINVGKALMSLAMVLAVSTVVAGLPTGGAAAIVMTPIIASLMAAGALLAFILPIMPFLIFSLAAVGYFLTVIEAIVAVSLWALGHMRMDGEGLSGEAGRQGWLLLLSLTFTPVLMIIGFLAGMIVFRVGAALIGTGFYYAASSIVGGDVLFGLLSIVGYSVLQAVIFLILLDKSFSLIVDFPQRVFKWIGQGERVVSQSFAAVPVTPRPRVAPPPPRAGAALPPPPRQRSDSR